ncbi:hypothetical protein STENM327S_07198 [Streptomyces tendae]
MDFDLLHEGALTRDPALLAHAEVRKGRLVVGAAAYDLVVIPRTPVLDADGVRVLREFVRTGGTVVAVGALDTEEADGGDRTLAHGLSDLFGDRVPARRSLGRGHAVRVADTGALSTAAVDAGTASAVLDPAQDAVRVLRVRRGPDTVFLINNESDAHVRTVAALPATGLPETWDPATGTGGPAPLYRATKDGVRVPLDLEPYRTAVVVVRGGHGDRPHLTESTVPVLSVERHGHVLRATVEAAAPGTAPVGPTAATATTAPYASTTRSPRSRARRRTLTFEREGAEPVTAPLAQLARSTADAPTLPKRVRSARLYIAGLGVYEATVNGKPVGDAVLEPANTDYAERVQYATYDVTDRLRTGANTLGVALGNGMSNVVSTADRYRKLYGNLSDPKLIARLEVTLADGRVRTITSGDDWRTTLGPTTASNWYGGEDYDARREIPRWDEPSGDRRGWRHAVAVAGPGTADRPALLSARETEPVRVVETLNGREVDGAEGSRVFDLGRNIAGWPEITVRAPKGTAIRVYPAESLKDGHAFQSISNVGAPLWDSYTSAGGGDAKTWHPRFGYHGFRYLELRGVPENATVSVRGHVLRADNASAGDFTSSDPLINGIHSLIRRSIEGNMMSVLTDCPSREKLGWLEQNQLVFPALAGNYDMRAYLRKIVRDMADAQTTDGLIPSTVPEYTSLPGAYRNDSNWGGAFVLVPWQLYRTYGDRQTLETYYPDMRRYAAFLETQVADGILDYGLGDWFTPDRTFPRAVAGTYGYWRVADTLGRIAALLGDTAAADEYRHKAAVSVEALTAKYYDATTGTFGGGGHGAEALALDMGAYPDGERGRLLAHFTGAVQDAGNHLLLGEISLPAAFRVLGAADRDDLVHAIATQTTSPSYGHQVLAGNTTLGESWDGGPGQSQNHFMLGAIDSWFTTRVVGLAQTEDSVGYARLLVDPAVEGDMTSAAGSYRTPYGVARTEWERSDDRFRLTVDVPAGSTAEVHVPVSTRHAEAPEGARLLRPTGGEAVYEVGSGHWTFRSTLARGR